MRKSRARQATAGSLLLLCMIYFYILTNSICNSTHPRIQGQEEKHKHVTVNATTFPNVLK